MVQDLLSTATLGAFLIFKVIKNSWSKEKQTITKLEGAKAEVLPHARFSCFEFHECLRLN